MAKKDSKAKPSTGNVKYPDKFTGGAIVGYVAQKNGLSRTDAQTMIDSYLDVLQVGMLKGLRVPLGTIGKLFVRTRPATGERKGRNPLTGQEITIKAKPATKVPKFSFSKVVKETVKKSK